MKTAVANDEFSINKLKHSLYDINKTYAQNVLEGPFFDGIFPQRELPPQNEWIDFLGFKVASRIGIPAGPLLTSRWIETAAKLGFDIVTYKTIRSKEYAGHGLPNIIYIDQDEQLDPLKLPNHVLQRLTTPREFQQIAITNSFGMPSMSPAFLRQDIPKAKQCLGKGQVLVVSVVGTPGADFIGDFVETALLAKDCGADIIEANFSCPNVTTGEGCIFTNPKTVAQISSRLTKALGKTPLIIKVGIFSNNDQMRQTFISAANSGVQAISGINTISMKVLNTLGKPALGPDRLTSGICGNPIRAAALDFIKQASYINEEEKLGLTLIGVGGIVAPEHFVQFFEAGAHISMSATGMMWNPYLASCFHRRAYVQAI